LGWPAMILKTRSMMLVESRWVQSGFSSGYSKVIINRLDDLDRANIVDCK
jgi:hypothetical protein